MAHCYPNTCCDYAVTPVLVTPMCQSPCCEEQPLCYPCLPCCPKGIYCCEKPKKASRKPERDRSHEEVCCETRHRRDKSPPRYRRPRSRTPPPHRSSRCDDCREPCCYPTCKPVKTQYVIPCYRYEDGRINQPTLLMRRACEVAVGSRTRRKPFVQQSYCADEFKEVHRYAAEDDRGNCCFHYHKRKTPPSCGYPPCQLCNTCHDPCFPCPNCGNHNCQLPSHQTVSSPQCCQYMDCVEASAVNNSKSGSCCFYC